MKHGISDESWENYLGGSLPPEERDQIEAHLIGCLACWEFHERMVKLNGRMRAAGAAMERSCVLGDDQLSAGLRGVFALICAQREVGETITQMQQRLGELEAVMAVFCGSQAAASAIKAAAENSPAKSLRDVTRENWEPFLQRLIAIAQVLCGRTGARWLLESGRL